MCRRHCGSIRIRAGIAADPRASTYVDVSRVWHVWTWTCTHKLVKDDEQIEYDDRAMFVRLGVEVPTGVWKSIEGESSRLLADGLGLHAHVEALAPWRDESERRRERILDDVERMSLDEREATLRAIQAAFGEMPNAV